MHRSQTSSDGINIPLFIKSYNHSFLYGDYENILELGKCDCMVHSSQISSDGIEATKVRVLYADDLNQLAADQRTDSQVSMVETINRLT